MLDPRKLKYDRLYESPKLSQALLDFPILAEIIEEMMLSRYHLTSDDEKWSIDALDFLSCTLDGSLESLMNVSKRYYIANTADQASIVSSGRLFPQRG